jgi:hypothetical protein
MKRFDSQWQTCAARARQTPPRDEPPPFGFAPRVVARAFRAEPPVSEPAWDRLAMRLLAGAAAVLVFCLAVEWPHLRDARPLEPGIENAVAQLVWSL